MDITSAEAGRLLRITGGALRQIETERKPASLALAFRASRLYNVPVEELVHDEVADQPKDQPKGEPKKDEPKIERVAPPRRTGNTGPKRAADDQAEAVA